MKQTRVLMNNTGSQAADIINLLHEENIYVVYYGTSENAAVKQEADEYHIEKIFSVAKTDSYADYLIDLCNKHKIDVFIPFRRMEELSIYKDKFDNAGIKVMIPDNIDMFKKLNNKVETYQMLKEIIPEVIPEYYLAKNLEELKKVCSILKDKREVCMKYVTDIASNSFRIINFNKHTLKELEEKTPIEKSKLSHIIDYDALIDILSKEPFRKDIIVMEYLPGKEISCDCLKTSKGNIIVPRKKETDKIQTIFQDPLIMKYCNKILDNIDYDTPCNIQFQMDSSGKPMLLEINTRMSGGVMIASWATGINIPLVAVNQVIGNEFDLDMNWPNVQMVKRMSYDKIQ